MPPSRYRFDVYSPCCTVKRLVTCASITPPEQTSTRPSLGLPVCSTCSPPTTPTWERQGLSRPESARHRQDAWSARRATYRRMISTVLVRVNGLVQPSCSSPADWCTRSISATTPRSLRASFSPQIHLLSAVKTSHIKIFSGSFGPVSTLTSSSPPATSNPLPHALPSLPSSGARFVA